MRSYLEIFSMDGSTNLPYGRHQQLLRNEYGRENQYDYNHPNARNTSGRGKSTGVVGGTQNWLPNLTGQIGIFNFSNFDTSLASNAGCEADVNARIQMLNRSMYTEEHPYEGSFDTTQSILEGQFSLQ